MRIPISDLTLHCNVTGQGDPVLFIHGFPISGEMWKPTVDRLGPAWRCIVPDLRGHGQSDASATTTMARLVDDLAELLEALPESRPAVVVGLSLGGMLAFEFFRRHRPRVRALVLCDTRANAETEKGVAVREATAQTALTAGTRAVVDQMVPAVFGSHFPPDQCRYWYDLMCRTSPVGVAATARAIGARRESFTTLPQIDCPTLVVAGDQDTFTPPDQMRAIHDAIPGAQWALISGSGHVPPIEAPDEFARILRTFLETLP